MGEPQQWAQQLWNEHLDRIRRYNTNEGRVAVSPLHNTRDAQQDERPGPLATSSIDSSLAHRTEIVQMELVSQAERQCSPYRYNLRERDADEAIQSNGLSSPSCTSTIADTDEDRKALDEKGRTSYYATRDWATRTTSCPSFLEPITTVIGNCCDLIALAVDKTRSLQPKESLQLLHAPYTLDGIHWSYSNGLKLCATFRPFTMGYRDYLLVAGPASSLPPHTYASSIKYYAGKQCLPDKACISGTQITHVEVLWHPRHFYAEELEPRQGRRAVDKFPTAMAPTPPGSPERLPPLA